MSKSTLGYQGKESTVILQAPTRKELNILVRSTRSHAKKNGMTEFRVLERGKDTDGGYRATVTAHNLNPITWIKSKVGSSESKTEARGQLEADREKSYEKKKRRLEEEQVRAAASQKRSETIRQEAQTIRAAKTATAQAKKATFEAEHPALVKTAEKAKKVPGYMARGAGSMVRGAGAIASTIREVSKTRGATSIKRKWGKGGQMVEEEIERAPRNFYAPTRSTMMGGGGMGGSLAHLRSLTAPGGMGGGDMGLSNLRNLMFPGQARGQKATRPTVHDLSEAQDDVYNAIMGGANTIPAIAVALDMKEASVKKAVKVLAKKGLID